MAENPTVVFTSPRQVEVEDRPVPKPGPGEVLIRTRCSLVSIGTELSVLDGESPSGEAWKSLRKYPYVPGYDNVGVVVDVGEGVDPGWMSKRISSWGGHTAYATVGTDRCWTVPDTVGDEDAAFLSLAHVALNGMRRSGLVFGEAAVVYGLGIIGQITAQLCRFAGARPVVGVDLSPWRVGFLPKKTGILGVAGADADVKKAVETATAGRMADVVFEVTGNPGVIPTEFEALHPQGRIVILSSPRDATLFDFHDLCNAMSTTIIGAHNFSHPRVATPGNPWTWGRHAEMFFDLAAAGEVAVAPLISHRESFQNAPDLYEMLLHDRSQAMGVLLTWPGQ